MTIAEMHIAAQVEIQKVGAHLFDDFLAEEVDLYLNRAQTTFIRDTINTRPEKLEMDLRTLIAQAVLLPAISAATDELGSPHEYIVVVPDDFYLLLSSETGLTRTGNPLIVNKEYVPNQMTNHDKVSKARVTTFNQPYLRNPRLLLMEDFFRLFCDHQTSAIDVRVRYVRTAEKLIYNPADSTLSRDCELPEITHTEIVSLAVALMVQDLQQPVVQP